jgi:hypothetical protein
MLHRRGAAPVIRKLWSRLARTRWSPAEQQERREQLGMPTRPATYEGPTFFTRGPFERD